MIRFFSKMRYKLAAENRAVKYLRYAVGEILLVVIGILIALQINNWNGDRKENHSMKIALKSLIEDLGKDTLQLNLEIQSLEKDRQRLNAFIIRLSKPTATIDTLKRIARYEYIPFFDPSNELNRNTIVSLLSTGNIDYFDENLKSIILTHNARQLKLLKIMDENVSIFLNSQYNQNFIMQSEMDSLFNNPVFIKGPLLEQYWSNMDDKQFLDIMLDKISGKLLMDQFLLSSKKRLLVSTHETLTYLKNFTDKND